MRERVEPCVLGVALWLAVVLWVFFPEFSQWLMDGLLLVLLWLNPEVVVWVKAVEGDL